MTEVLRSAAAAGRRLSLPRPRFGWSEGDTWTVGIGLVLAVSLAVSTIPAVLDARDVAPRAAAPAVEAPAAPAAPGAAPVAAPVVPVAVPVPQPLLGPLVPSVPGSPAEVVVPAPAPGPGSGPAAGPPGPAPGEVRQFAAVPAAGGVPGAVTAAADGSVWAGTDAPAEGGGAAQLLTWDATGALTGTAEVPDSPADRRTRGLTGVATRPDGSLVAVDAATSRLLGYDPTAEQAGAAWSTLAQVPDVAPCLLLGEAPCQPGVLDTPPLLRGVAVDGAGTTYVADAGQGTIWRLLPGGSLESWYSSADVAGPEGLAGLAVDDEGHLRVVVTRLADVQGTAAGALLRIDRAADGSAGARTVVAAFEVGEDAVDVALGASGNAYVALRGVHAVVTLDRTGFEQLRVVDDALQEPTAVHLVAGRVLVTAAAPAPAVLEIGVKDEPLRPGGPARD